MATDNLCPVTAYEKALAEDGSLLFTPGGQSMRPMLKSHRNPVVILPVGSKQKLSKYDVVFYKRLNGQYVLHRIIAVLDNGYVCCGDGQFTREYGVTDGMIFGILAGYYKGKRYVNASTSLLYKAYSVLRVASRPWRAFFHRSVNYALKQLKKATTDKSSR